MSGRARQSIGAYKSWERTVNRTERTSPGRNASPSSIEWHLARLDPERFANATESQRIAAAEMARRRYFAELALRSASVRRRKGAA